MLYLKQLVEIVGYEDKGAGHFAWILMTGLRVMLNFRYFQATHYGH